MRDGVLIFDGHTHDWDASKENVRNKWGENWIECFYSFHKALTQDKRWMMDYETTFRPEARRKILGKNLAALYGIDVAAKLTELGGDDLSR